MKVEMGRIDSEHCRGELFNVWFVLDDSARDRAVAEGRAQWEEVTQQVWKESVLPWLRNLQHD